MKLDFEDIELDLILAEAMRVVCSRARRRSSSSSPRSHRPFFKADRAR